jgi:putative intracellular protease/amidase
MKWVFALVLVGMAGASNASERPVIAVLANNDGTETTDFLVPYGVLRASDAADVYAVALRPGDVELMPALRVRVPLDLAAFDASHPGGADYVIVPAMHQSADPVIGAWLRRQAASGATLVGICDGAWVLAEAGLLDGRSATSHWFSIEKLRERVPGMTWVEDRRYVIDGKVVTTTGVSASIPVSLMLIESIAGHERAQAVASQLGVASWDPAHHSAAFALDRHAVWTAASNLLAFWSWDEVRIPVSDGGDEVALALTADAWARTYRTTVRSASAVPGDVTLRNGLVLIPDETLADAAQARVAVPPAGTSALQTALAGIQERYGAGTADFVALQLEYPR